MFIRRGCQVGLEMSMVCRFPPLTVKKIHLKCQHEIGMQVVNNGQNLVNVVKECPLTSKTELYLMVSSVPANTVLCTLSSRKNLLAVSSLLVPKPRPKQRMSLLDSNLVNMYHRVSKVVAHYKNALHNEGTGIPQLVRFQLVRSPIQCGFYQKTSQKTLFINIFFQLFNLFFKHLMHIKLST